MKNFITKYLQLEMRRYFYVRAPKIRNEPIFTNNYKLQLTTKGYKHIVLGVQILRSTNKDFQTVFY